jgi:hypothetical protein
MINKVSKCHMCSRFFDSKKKLKDHIDKSHRITNFITVTNTEAEKISDYILSSSADILSVAVIERCGNIISAKVKESFKERFRVDNLDRAKYNGSLAVATLSVISEVKDVFEEPEAVITIHRDCKLMLMPMLSYDILIGLILERSADADDGTIAKKITRALEYTLKPQL